MLALAAALALTRTEPPPTQKPKEGGLSTQENAPFAHFGRPQSFRNGSALLRPSCKRFTVLLVRVVEHASGCPRQGRTVVDESALRTGSDSNIFRPGPAAVLVLRRAVRTGDRRRSSQRRRNRRGSSRRHAGVFGGR